MADVDKDQVMQTRHRHGRRTPPGSATRAFWLALTSVSLIACDAARPSSGDVPAVLVRDDAVSCELVITPTGVELWSDLEGSVPDPRWPIARSSSGLFYSNTSYSGSLAVWTPDGRFSHSIGRPGEGPGELKGFLTPFAAVDGNVHVRDNAPSWSVFDSAGTFIRRMPARYIGAMVQNTAFLDDGTVLTGHAALRGEAEPAYFHVANYDGELVRSFGELTREDRAHFTATRGHVRRVIGYGGGDTFWAAQRPGSSQGYTLEQWSVDGRLLRTLRRDADWFRVTPARNRSTMDIEPPLIMGLHVDSLGLLVVYSAVMKRATEDLAGTGDIHIEVIDPSQSAVVAATVLADVSFMDHSVVDWWFPGSRLGYRLRQNPEGVPWVQLITMHLVPSSSAPLPACGTSFHHNETGQ